MKFSSLITVQLCFLSAVFTTVSPNVSPNLYAQEPAPKITYDDHVKQILNQRCSSCHSGNKKEADLDVTNYTALMLGGGSGEVIAAGAAVDSYLYKLITHEESPEMPPNGTKIPDPEIKMIADWINLGALENAGSVARKAKPKKDLTLSGDATVRPETIVLPLTMPLEPVIKTPRPSATAIATSPWAKVVAIAAPKQVLLYATDSLELLGVLPMEEGIAHTLKFSRNGSLLLGGGGKDGQLGTTIVWDVKTGERITKIGEELDVILAADISPSHEWVAMGGPNKVVKVFSLADGSLRYEINKHTDWVTAIEFSPDGKWLATGDRAGGLQVWDTATGAERFSLAPHTAAVTDLSWRVDSKILATASEDATIRTWEMDKGGQLKSWGAHGGGVTALEFLRDGNLISGGRDKVAKTWDQNGTMIRQFPGMSDVIVAAAFCNESGRALAADWTGAVRVWNGADGVDVGTLIANPPTLAERLTASQQKLNEAKEKQMPMVAAVEQSKAKLAEVTSTLTVTQQSRQLTDAKIVESQAKLAAAKQQFESTAAQQAAWQTEQKEKATAKPLIEETFTKAVAAASALPADEELKGTVAQLDTKQQSIAARLDELSSLVTKSDEEKKVVQKNMDELSSLLASDAKELEKLTAEEAQLQSQIGPLTTQIESETQAVAVVATELAEAQAKIEKWNGNLEFIKQLGSLNQELDKTEQVVVEREAVVEEAERKVQAAQTEADQAKQQQEATAAEAEQLRQKILELRGGS